MDNKGSSGNESYRRFVEALESSEDSLSNFTSLYNNTANPNNPDKIGYKRLRDAVGVLEKDLKENINTLKDEVDNLKRTTQENASKLERDVQLLEKKRKQTQRSFNSKLVEFQKRIKDSSESVIQTLAVFVGLFTFSSIEFQIFKSADKNAIVPLTFIFGGFVLLITSIFAIILKDSSLESPRRKIFILSLPLLSVILIGYGTHKYEKMSSSGANSIVEICARADKEIGNAKLRAEEEPKGFRQTYNTLMCEEVLNATH